MCEECEEACSVYMCEECEEVCSVCVRCVKSE